MLKAITLYEPWASLMAIGAKRNETRGCRTSHRGDIAIHAAKTTQALAPAIINAYHNRGMVPPPNTPEALVPAVIDAYHNRGIVPSPDTLGCIVAVVDLWDVQPAEKFDTFRTNDKELIPITKEEFMFGNYNGGCGRWIFRTRNLRRLTTPIPTRGYQSIGWTVPPDVEAQVREQLRTITPI
jgi:hypothetical protein